MRKVMKTIKVEKKKKKSVSEKTCLEVLHEVAKAMADNCEIEIRIIHPDTKIHLVPTVDDDENEESEWHGDLSPSIEAMKQIFNGDDTACCGNYCDHPFTVGDPENPNMKQAEKVDRAEAAGESM